MKINLFKGNQPCKICQLKPGDLCITESCGDNVYMVVSVFSAMRIDAHKNCTYAVSMDDGRVTYFNNNDEVTLVNQVNTLEVSI